MNPCFLRDRTAREQLLLSTSVALAFILSVQPFANAPGATVIWSGLSGADWNTGSNWSGASKPGTGDTALFNTSLSSVLNAIANQTVTSITFDTNAGTPSGSFTLGTVGGSKFTLSNGGTIQLTSGLSGTGKTIIVNAPLSLVTGTYTFANNNATVTNTLIFGGPISASATGTETLTLTGGNTGANTISGSISNGSATTFNLLKTGSGTWNLSGSNTYTGTTTISSGTLIISGNSTFAGAAAVNGGTLQVSGAAGQISGTSGVTVRAGGTFIDGDTGTAANNNGIANRVKATTTLSLSGGTFQLAAAAAGNSHSQDFSALSLGGGLSILSANAATGTNTLTFNNNGASNYIRAVGSLLNINSQTGFNVAFANAVTANAAGSGADAILLGATLNNFDFVTAAAGNVAAASYTATGTSTWTAGKNMNVTGSNSSPFAAADVNSVRFNASGANTITLDAAGTNTIAGGILVTSNVGANLSTIAGGAIRGGSGKDLIIVQNGGATALTGLTIGSAIADNGTSSLSKFGAGYLTLSGLSSTAADNYAGTTIIDRGTVAITSDVSLTGGLTFGSTPGSANAVTLDLTPSNATFGGSFLVQTNSSSVNSVLIGSGKTLNVNGPLTIGANMGVSSTTKLTLSGGGAFNVNAPAGDFTLGLGQTTQDFSNSSTLDVSALSSFTASVTNFRVGYGQTSYGNLVLSNTSNAVTATTLDLGNSVSYNATGTPQITLGTGTNVIHADLINIGIAKANATMQFQSQAAGSPGTLTIASKAGTGGADIVVGSNNGLATAAVFAGTLDLRGHVATVNAGNLKIGIGSNTSSGNVAGVLSFDSGEFTVNNIELASKTGGTGAGTGTINLGGGTFTVNSGFKMATNYGTTGSATATLNVTGGILTSNVDILKGGGAGTTATVTLNGGTIDLLGHKLGDGTNLINVLNFQLGTLQNVASINGSAGLTKTTNGILTLSGVNSYTGNTIIDQGTLKIGATGAVPTGAGRGDLVFNTAANSAVLDINGFDTTINGLTASASTTNKVVNNATSTTGTLTVGNNDASSSFAGVIANNTGTGGVLALAKTGTGTLTLSGSNTYSGGTRIIAGTLLFSGASATPTAGGISVEAAGNLSFADGTARGFTVPALTLASGATLRFDWTGAGTGDQLASTAGITPTAGSTIGISANITGSPSGVVTLITGGSGSTLNSSNFFLANNTNYTATLTVSPSTVAIGSYATATALSNAYWLGGQVAGAPGAMALSNGTISNWAADAAGTPANGVVPGGASSNAIFSASGAVEEANVFLGADMTLGSLTFNDSASVTLGGSHTITLMGTSSTEASTTGALQTVTPGSAISVTSYAADPVIDANLLLGSGQTWNLASGKNLTVNGVITGSSSLTKAGAGLLTLNGENAFSGGFVIAEGSVRLGSPAALGSSASAVTVASGAVLDLNGQAITNTNTLTLNGSGISGGGALSNSSTTPATYAGLITLGSTSSVIASGGSIALSNAGTITGAGFELTVGGASDVTIASIIGTGSGALTKQDAGTLTLSGANTYSGGTALNQGTLTLGNASALGTGMLTINGGTLDSSISNLVNSQNNAQTWGADFTFTGTQNLNLGTGAVTLSGSRMVTVNNNTLTVGGAISGTGFSLTKSGAGALILSGANSYSGGTALNQGTLTLGNASALGTGMLTINGGTLDSSISNLVNSQNNAQTWGADFTFAGTQNLNLGTGTVAMSGSRTVTVTNNTLTAGGVVSGTGYSLIKSGAGTLALTGSNTFSGGTVINQGVLKFSSDASLGAAGVGVTLAGGTFDYSGASQATVSRPITLSADSSVRNSSSQALFVTGKISDGADSFGLTILGGAVYLNNGANDYDGAVLVKSGASLYTQSNNALGSALGATTVEGTLSVETNYATPETLYLNGGVLRTSSEGNTMYWSGPVALGANSTIRAKNQTATATLVVNGPVSGNYNLTIGTPGIESGVVFLTGNNTYSGSTSLTAGTLMARSASALGSGPSSVSVATGTVLNYVASSDAALSIGGTLGITGGTGTVIGASIGASATSAQISVAGNATATGAVGVNVYSISGVIPLEGTTTYTLIHGEGGSSALNNAAYSLNRVYNNTHFTISSLAATAHDLQIDVTRASPLTTAYWQGGLSGAANVWAASDGTTQSNWVASLGGANQALVPGALADVVFSNSSVTTAPTSTYLGADMTINSLTLADTSNALGLKADGFTLSIAPVDPGSGITVNTGVPASSLAANLLLGADQTWTNNSASTLSVSGTISGAHALTKAGSGTLSLSGANTFSGGTTLSAGTLSLANAGALGTGTFTITGGTLDSSVTNLINSQNNAQNWNGDFTFAGSQNLDLGRGAVTLNASPIVTVNNRTLTVGGAVNDGSSSFGLTKAGVGTLVLSGLSATASDNYGGTTAIDRGILTIAATNPFLSGGLAFGSSSGNTNVGTLDLSGASATFGGLTVQTNSTSANTITIGAGRTLSTNGNVSIGMDGAAGATAKLTVTGSGGTWSVSNPGGTFRVGIATTSNYYDSGILDLSGLGNFDADLGSTGSFRIGNASGAANGIGTASLNLASSANLITAGTLGIFDQSGNTQAVSLKLGSNATHLLHANTINVGATGASWQRAAASLSFSGAGTGSVKIRGADGTSAAALNMITGSIATGNLTTSNFDVTGHSADLLFSTVDLMDVSSPNNAYSSIFSFDTGTLISSVSKIGTRTGGPGAFLPTATMNLGSGTGNFSSTAALGDVTIAQMSGTTTNGGISGVLNVSGSNTTLNMSSLAVAVSSNTTGRGTAAGAVNIFGGSVTVAGNVTLGNRTGSAGMAAGTINLNGGMLAVGGTITQPGSGGFGTINFNGGTLQANGSSATFLQGLAAANVFGGAVIDTNGNNITVAQDLLAGAVTLSVSSVGITTAGTGYSASATLPVTFAAAPAGGRTATGSATTDATGKITAIVISDPGVGYLSAPSIEAINSAAPDGAYIVNTASAYGISITGGGLTKQGIGTLTLTGTNTYTGATRISNGTLRALSLANGGTASAIGQSDSSAFNLVIDGGTLAHDAANRASTNRLLTIGGTAGDTATIDSSATSAADIVEFTSSGSLAFGNTNAHALILTGSNTGDNLFAPVIGDNTGATSLTKSGTGDWILSGANIYRGITTISSGTLIAASSSALGAISGSTTVVSGGTLELADGLNYGAAEPLSLNGSGAGNSGALRGGATSSSFAGPITIATNATIHSGGGNLTLSGGINKDGTVLTFTGGGAISVSGTGISGSTPNSDLVVDGTTVTLQAASSYNGPTYLRNAGTLNANVTGALPTANGRTPLIMDDSGSGSSTLVLGANQSVASLAGTQSTSEIKLNANTLTIGSSAGSTHFAGAITGSGGLIKDGASTQILSSVTSDYSGGTVVNDGTLLANNLSGSATGSGTVSVNSGATLGGTGRIGGDVELVGGTLNAGAAGNDIGNLTIGGNLSASASSTWLVDLTLGTSSVDLVTIGGAVDLRNITLQIANGGTDLSASTYRFASFTSGAWSGNPFEGDTNGIFYGTNNAAFTVRYDDEGGGFYLDLMAVPEPEAWLPAMLALGLGLFLSRRRRTSGACPAEADPSTLLGGKR